LEGYCPVTLVEQERWQKGDARFGAIHRSRTYLFTSAAEQQKFLANPDAYSPVLSGFDPVRYLERSELVEGKRKHGLFYDKRIYLFADEDSLQRFWKSHPTYVQAVQEAMTRNAAAPQMNR
jgi:protein disulfide-isomerase